MNPFFQNVLVTDFLQSSARIFSDKVALIFGDKELTYREIDDASSRLANALLNSGIQRGDRVLVILGNTPETIISLFGILKSGGVFCLLHPGTKAERFLSILEDSEARYLISDYHHIEILGNNKKKIANLEHIWLRAEALTRNKINNVSYIYHSLEQDLYIGSEICPEIACIDMDLAALIYTSGTLGKPKGVMITQHNIIANTTSINKYLGNTSLDVILVVLPLSFGYGLYQVFMAFQIGATIVLERSFTQPYSVISRIVTQKISALPGVPTMFSLISQLRLNNFDLSNIRYITNAGAPMPLPLLNKLQNIFPASKIFLMYGLTECQRVSFLQPEEINNRPLSVGKAISNVELYIVDDLGYPVPPGAVGELVVRGSGVMKGYWRDDEATSKSMHLSFLPDEKFLFTGDLFKRDNEGYLYYVSRKDEAFKSQGQLIRPKEIEDVIYKIEGVKEVKVFDINDDVLGKAIAAAIVSDIETISDLDIRRHCNKFLENYKVPSKVKFVLDLPKTLNGKVELETLRKIFQ